MKVKIRHHSIVGKISGEAKIPRHHVIEISYPNTEHTRGNPTLRISVDADGKIYLNANGYLLISPRSSNSAYVLTRHTR